MRLMSGCRLLRGSIFAVLLVTAVPSAAADVVQVRDFKLSVPQDRRILFSMAVTPSGDVLSFVASKTGEWSLYRIRHWTDEMPSHDTLPLPGFFSKKDGPDLKFLTSQVFVTQDGAYAVCVGSASWWKTQAGRAIKGMSSSYDVISVVDLATYEVVATSRTRALHLLDFHDVKLDHQDNLLVDSLSSDKPKRGAFVRLAIPSLAPGPKCGYNWISDSATKEHREATTEGACRDSLGSAATFDQYIRAEFPPFAWPPAVCKDNAAQFCRWPGNFTPDGRYGVAMRSESPDTLFGYTESHRSYIVFSASKRSDIVELKLPTNDSVISEFASLEGRDYLLVLQHGTHLTVYELRD